VNNLPPIDHLVQHDRAPVQKAGFVIKMEGCDCRVSEALEVEIGRPQVHVGRLGPISANLGKHLLEVCLDLGASLCATGKAAGIEDGGIIGKKLRNLSQSRLSNAWMKLWRAASGPASATFGRAQANPVCRSSRRITKKFFILCFSRRL